MIFVYGILSAMASLLQEIQSQYLEIRPKFLVKAIRRMLSNDEDASKMNSVGWQVLDFFKRGVTVFFFPLVYIIMARNARKKNMESTQAISASTEKLLSVSGGAADANLVVDLSKGDAFMNAFFENSLIKYLGSKNFRKPSYISKEMFTSALVEICHLKKYPESIQDFDAAKDSKVSFFGVKMPDTVEKVLTAFLKEAFRTTWHEKDPESKKSVIEKKFRALIASWYEETMHRATGWYKIDTGLWLFWWGLALAIALNVDTFRVFRHFMTDVNARQIVKSQALQWNSKSGEEKGNLLRRDDSVTTPVDSLKAQLVKTWNGELKSMKTRRLFGWNFELPKPSVVDSALLKPHAVVFDTTLKTLFDSVRTELAIQKSTRNKLDSLFAGLKQEKSNLDSLEKVAIASSRKSLEPLAFASSLKVAKERNRAKELENARIDSVKKVEENKFDLINSIYTVPKIGCSLSKQFLHSWWGMLVTAMAISFGAPFWFDLLSSLVKLGGSGASVRYSGVKPEDKKT